MSNRADPSQDGRFERLFVSYREPIYNYLYRLLGDAAQAEEVCQDVFVRAYRALARLPEDANHRAWLYRIATNCATDRHRRRRLIQWLPLRDGDARNPAGRGRSVEDTVAEEAAVQDALETLPLAYRQALVLYSVQGYSVREISEMLGVSESAVKVRLYRARIKFRAAYGEGDDDAV